MLKVGDRVKLLDNCYNTFDVYSERFARGSTGKVTKTFSQDSHWFDACHVVMDDDKSKDPFPYFLYFEEVEIIHGT